MIEYIRDFMAKMAVVISIEKSVAEGEKVLTFYRGLRHSMQRLCSFDPLVQGPFQTLDALISTATARDDTHSPSHDSAPRNSNPRPHRHTSSNQGNATVHVRGRGGGVSKRNGFRVRCHACRQIGHVRANCPNRGNAEDASAPRHNGPGGRNGNRRGKGPGDVKYALPREFPNLIFAQLVSTVPNGLECLDKEDCIDPSKYRSKTVFVHPVRDQSSEALFAYHIAKQRYPEASAYFLLPTSVSKKLQASAPKLFRGLVLVREGVRDQILEGGTNEPNDMLLCPYNYQSGMGSQPNSTCICPLPLTIQMHVS